MGDKSEKKYVIKNFLTRINGTEVFELKPDVRDKKDELIGQYKTAFKSNDLFKLLELKAGAEKRGDKEMLDQCEAQLKYCDYIIANMLGVISEVRI